MNEEQTIHFLEKLENPRPYNHNYKKIEKQMNEQKIKNILKKEMKTQGFTYKSMGEDLGMSERGIRSLLNDHRAPFYRLLALGGKLGMGIELNRNLTPVDSLKRKLVELPILNLEDFQKFKMKENDLEWKTWCGFNGRQGGFHSENMSKHCGSGFVGLNFKECENKMVWIEK